MISLLLAGALAAAPATSRYQVTVHPLPGRQAGAESLALRMRGLLEALEAAYLGFWSGTVTRGRLPDAVRVELFEDPHALRERLAAFGAGTLTYEAGGAFIRHSHTDPPTLLVLAASPLERINAANLVHEAAHMLNHAVLGDALSPWLNEGMAGFCQYSAIGQEGEILLGRLDPGSAITVTQGGQRVTHRFEPARSLSYLSGQFASDSKLSVAPMMRVSAPDAFYRTNAQLHYAASWTLVHLLAEGSVRAAGGRLRPQLMRYAALEQQGRGGVEALLALLQIPLEDLDYAWFRHVRKLE